MKLPQPTFADLMILGGVAVVGYLAYKAFKTVSDTVSSIDVSKIPDMVVSGAVKAVDARKVEQDPNEFSLGGIQMAVSNAVQRGQDAGASNFVSAYFTGLFK